MQCLKILSYLCIISLVTCRKEEASPLDQFDDYPFLLHFIKRFEKDKVYGGKSTLTTHGTDNSDSDKGKGSTSDELIKDKLGDNFQGAPDANKNPNIDNHIKLTDSEGNVCPYSRKSKMIIKSNESRENGANFLRAHSTNESNCIRSCCYTQGCTLAVFEDKGNHTCYLFNCGYPSKCKFAEHDSYISMMIDNDDNSNTEESHFPHLSNHESDLQGLGKKTPMPTTKPSTTTTTEITPVALFGRCSTDNGDKCVDANSECINGKCQCKETFHAKYGVCRRQCSDQEFECMNMGQTGVVPDCVTITHVCDGTPQCADGSDETQCMKENTSLEKNVGQTKTQQKSTDLDRTSTNFRNPMNSLSQQYQPGMVASPYLGSNGNNLPYNIPKQPTNINPVFPQGVNQLSQPYQQLLGQAYGNPYWTQQELRSSLQTGSGYYNPNGPNGPLMRPSNQGIMNAGLNSGRGDYLRPNAVEKSGYNAPMSIQPDDMLNDNINDHIEMPNMALTQRKPSLDVSPNDGNGRNYLDNNYESLDPFSQDRYSAYHPGRLGDISREHDDRNYGAVNNKHSQSAKTKATTKVPTTVAPTTTTTTPMPTTTTSSTPQTSTLKNIMNKDNALNDFDSFGHLETEQGRSRNRGRTHDRFNQQPGKVRNPSRGKPKAGYNNNYRGGSHYQGERKGMQGRKNMNPSGYDRYPFYDERYTGYSGWPQYDNYFYDLGNQEYPDASNGDGGSYDFAGSRKAPSLPDLKTPKSTSNPPTPIPSKPSTTSAPTASMAKPKTSTKLLFKTPHPTVPQKFNSTQKTSPTAKNGTAVKLSSSGSKSVIYDEDVGVVLVESPDGGAQGPIIALSLGLAFTLMLLVIVGCRLRTVKRRIRKGRALHSNEADYLINGMYL